MLDVLSTPLGEVEDTPLPFKEPSQPELEQRIFVPLRRGAYEPRIVRRPSDRIQRSKPRLHRRSRRGRTRRGDGRHRRNKGARPRRGRLSVGPALIKLQSIPETIQIQIQTVREGGIP